jgi:hypothetical protein
MPGGREKLKFSVRSADTWRMDSFDISTVPEPPKFEEDIAPAFAKLLTWFAEDMGAPMFAADLAEKGCKPDALRMMADRWRDPSIAFEPQEAGDVLDEFADAIAEQTQGNIA